MGRRDFPGPSATVYTNEAGEILGWDYDPGPDPFPGDDPYDDAFYKAWEDYDDAH